MSRCLYFIGPLVLLSLSIPLAFLAVITTTLAFSTLLVRASIVYSELGVALIRSWLFVNKNPVQTTFRPSTYSPSFDLTSEPRRRHRRRNSASIAVPAIPAAYRAPRKSESFSSLFGSNPNRDFEGVGGWSLTRDGQDEAIWLINSRLQLPMPPGDNRRRHRRSLTSGSLRLKRNVESARQSPIVSRNQTPSAADGTVSPESYFNLQTNDSHFESLEEVAAYRRLNDRQKFINSSAVSSPGVTRSSRL